MPFRPVWAILARGFSRARGRKPMRALLRGPERLEALNVAIMVHKLRDVRTVARKRP